ncbi:MAG: GAF domain-containing protein [Deltaproteobacteria bacterium]|nr:GAF domain-containing protein [Deltaproteobacteria bacterium]
MPAVKQLEVPKDVMADWQSIIDLMAKMIDVPVGLIMRVIDQEIEVYLSSETKGNPYHPGDHEHLWESGLYCETVIKTQDCLVVPNALRDKAWENNPDIKLNMIAYLGYPINLPDGSPFGTICVLDRQEKQYNDLHLNLVRRFRDLIESNLGLIYMNKLFHGENLRLLDYIAEIKTLRGIIPICASCKKIRADKGYWEQIEKYIMDRTEAQFSHGICPDCAKKLYPEFYVGKL